MGLNVRSVTVTDGIRTLSHLSQARGPTRPGPPSPASPEGTRVSGFAVCVPSPLEGLLLILVGSVYL